MMWIAQVLDEKGRITYEIFLRGPKCRVGRHPDNCLSFPGDKSLSRNHAEIQIVNDGAVLVDLRSKFGTSQLKQLGDSNPVKLGNNEPQEILPGTIIKFGATTSVIILTQRRMSFCSTMLNKEERDKVKSSADILGARVVKIPEKATHIITNVIKGVTNKIMLGLLFSADKILVTTDWLQFAFSSRPSEIFPSVDKYFPTVDETALRIIDQGTPRAGLLTNHIVLVLSQLSYETYASVLQGMGAKVLLVRGGVNDEECLAMIESYRGNNHNNHSVMCTFLNEADIKDESSQVETAQNIWTDGMLWFNSARLANAVLANTTPVLTNDVPQFLLTGGGAHGTSSFCSQLGPSSSQYLTTQPSQMIIRSNRYHPVSVSTPGAPPTTAPTGTTTSSHTHSTTAPPPVPSAVTLPDKKSSSAAFTKCTSVNKRDSIAEVEVSIVPVPSIENAIRSTINNKNEISGGGDNDDDGGDNEGWRESQAPEPADMSLIYKAGVSRGIESTTGKSSSSSSVITSTTTMGNNERTEKTSSLQRSVKKRTREEPPSVVSSSGTIDVSTRKRPKNVPIINDSINEVVVLSETEARRSVSTTSSNDKDDDDDIQSSSSSRQSQSDDATTSSRCSHVVVTNGVVSSPSPRNTTRSRSVNAASSSSDVVENRALVTSSSVAVVNDISSNSNRGFMSSSSVGRLSVVDDNMGGDENNNDNEVEEEDEDGWVAAVKNERRNRIIAEKLRILRDQHNEEADSFEHGGDGSESNYSNSKYLISQVEAEVIEKPLLIVAPRDGVVSSRKRSHTSESSGSSSSSSSSLQQQHNNNNNNRDVRRFRKNFIRLIHRGNILSARFMDVVLPKESEREIQLRLDANVDEEEEERAEMLFADRYVPTKRIIFLPILLPYSLLLLTVVLIPINVLYIHNLRICVKFNLLHWLYSYIYSQVGCQ